MKCHLAVLLFAVSIPALAQTSNESSEPIERKIRPHDIETGALALECANYSRYIDDEARFHELMLIGRNKVVGFLDAFARGEITEQEYRDHVGLDISFKMRAPTADFAAGRIFEYYSSLVDHWITYERNTDGSVDETRTREPWERQVAEAERLYGENKCHLIE